MMKIDGKCHCGDLAYTAEIDPERITICHCSDCQELSGTAYRVDAQVGADAFGMSGRPALYERTAASGRTARPRLLPALRHQHLRDRNRRARRGPEPAPRNGPPAAPTAAVAADMVRLGARLDAGPDGRAEVREIRRLAPHAAFCTWYSLIATMWIIFQRSAS